MSEPLDLGPIKARWDDNRLENLELTTRGDHIRDHHAKVRDPSRWVTVNCTQCGVEFDRRMGEFVKYSRWFCSRECYLIECYLIDHASEKVAS